MSQFGQIIYEIANVMLIRSLSQSSADGLEVVLYSRRTGYQFSIQYELIP